MIKFLVLLLVLPFLSAYSYAASIPCNVTTAPDSIKGSVTKITDGDTINMGTSAKYYSIRVLNIDAPETNYQGQTQGMWGEKAKENLNKLIPIGTKVTVKFDAETCDMYKRWLGTIYRDSDGLDVNAQQIKDGYAVLYCIYPNIGNCKEYSKYQKQAMEEGISFVTDPSIELPYLFRHDGTNSKPVADLIGFAVYQPEDMENIPVYNRLFFMDWSSVEDPYYEVQ